MPTTKKTGPQFMGHLGKTKKQRDSWDICELGYLVHTGLRKGCDSKITTIAWNLIYGLPHEWRLLLGVWEKAIRSGLISTKSHEQFARDSKLYFGSDDDRCLLGGKGYDQRPEDPMDEPVIDKSGNWDTKFWETKTEARRNLYIALVRTFSLFSEDDWSGATICLFNG